MEGFLDRSSRNKQARITAEMHNVNCSKSATLGAYSVIITEECI